MFSLLKRALFPEKFATMVGSPTKAEKAVGALTKDKDEAMGLAFGRIAKSLDSENELVKHLSHMRESDIQAEIKKLEEGNKYFDGFSELYQMPPNGFRTQWNAGGSYTPIYNGHSYLSRRLETLNAVKDSTKAVLVIGSDHASAKQFRTQGYPVLKQFTTVFDTPYIFLSQSDDTVIKSARAKDEFFVYHLKDVSGTFGYKNRIIVVLDEKTKIVENFTESTKDDGRHMLFRCRLDDKQYQATPEKIVAVLEPPDEKELYLLDATVIAYGGKLLRLGYFLGTQGETPDNNMWTGGGMNLFLNAAYGIKEEWRPFLTHASWQSDSLLPDVSLRSVETAVRALHVVNRLTEVFQKHELI